MDGPKGEAVVCSQQHHGRRKSTWGFAHDRSYIYIYKYILYIIHIPILPITSEGNFKFKKVRTYTSGCKKNPLRRVDVKNDINKCKRSDIITIDYTYKLPQERLNSQETRSERIQCHIKEEEDQVKREEFQYEGR